MKIITWNVGGGLIKNEEGSYDVEDLNYCINELKKQNADVICLQEPHVSKDHNQSLEIAKALGFPFVEFYETSESHIKENQSLSVAILSKFPIIQTENFKLTNPNLESIWDGVHVKSHDKAILKCELEIDNEIVTVFVTHLFPFKIFGRNFMEKEFEPIRKEIESFILTSEHPSILCGDMNYENVQELLPNLFENGFVSVLNKEPTTPNNRIIDKILVSKELNVLGSEIVKGKCDHYLCFVEVSLKI